MIDIVLNKTQSIQRCVRRTVEEYNASVGDFIQDYSHQDAAMLNLLRACETTVDLANYVIRSMKLGIPDSSSDCFRVLREKNVIHEDLSERMIQMVSLRNHIVHQYQKVDARRIEVVIREDMNFFLEFADVILQYAQSEIQ